MPMFEFLRNDCGGYFQPPQVVTTRWKQPADIALNAAVAAGCADNRRKPPHRFSGSP